jgi:hypothetical protein
LGQAGEAESGTLIEVVEAEEQERLTLALAWMRVEQAARLARCKRVKTQTSDSQPSPHSLNGGRPTRTCCYVTDNAATKPCRGSIRRLRAHLWSRPDAF